MTRMRTPRTIIFQRHKIRHLPSRVTQPEGSTGTKCIEGDVGNSQVAGCRISLLRDSCRKDRPRAKVDHPLFHIFVHLRTCQTDV